MLVSLSFLIFSSSVIEVRSWFNICYVPRNIVISMLPVQFHPLSISHPTMKQVRLKIACPNKNADASIFFLIIIFSMSTVYQPNGNIVSTVYHFLISSVLKVWILKHYNVLRKHHLLKSSGPFRSGLYGPLFWLTHNSVPEIDRCITMPLKGMKDDDLYTYYNEASALEKLKDGMSVSIPFLCVTAKNDPFIPPPVRPTKEVAQSNENIFVVNTKLGGHIGKCIK